MKHVIFGSGSERRAAPFMPSQPNQQLGVEETVRQYLDHRAMQGSTAQTLLSIRRYLGEFAAWLRARGIVLVAALDADVLQDYQLHIFNYRKPDGMPLAPASKLAKLFPLRSWLRWMARAHGIDAGLFDCVELPTRDEMLPKELLSVSQAEAVMATCRLDIPAGLRDRAILEVLYATGIRRMELAQLRLGEIDLERGVVHIRNGKGRKDRRVPLGPRAVAWLRAYLEFGRPALTGAAKSFVLFPSKGGEPFCLTSLSTLVSSHVRKAGFAGMGACHLFRHSMATLMLDGGADIRYIQTMLGHAQLSTTQIYTQVSTTRLSQVHATTHPGARAFEGSIELPLLRKRSAKA